MSGFAQQNLSKNPNHQEAASHAFVAQTRRKGRQLRPRHLVDGVVKLFQSRYPHTRGMRRAKQFIPPSPQLDWNPNMKKTLIAVAALSATAGAFAQSSVTLYGILDASVGYVNKANVEGKSATYMNDSALQSSYWGIRGSEDIAVA